MMASLEDGHPDAAGSRQTSLIFLIITNLFFLPKATKCNECGLWVPYSPSMIVCNEE